MSRRLLLGAALLAAVALNTVSGVIRIAGFRHRHAGELALAEGDLNAAYAHFRAARRWQPGRRMFCGPVPRSKINTSVISLKRT